MDRASINQLAASDSSPSSRNIVLKASVTLSYRVYTVLLKRIVNKTPMLKVVLEALKALELLKLLGPLEASELKIYNVF